MTPILGHSDFGDLPAWARWILGAIVWVIGFVSSIKDRFRK